MEIDEEKGRRGGTSFAVPDYLQRQTKMEGVERSQLGCPRSTSSEGLHFGSRDKSEIVLLSEKGAQRSRDLFEKYFAK